MTEPKLQVFLDAISGCFITGEFDVWRDHILLPFSIVTAEGSEILTSEAELRENFGLYLQACQIMSLDQIVRRPIEFELCEDGAWMATYETSLLSRGQRATDPYVSTALIHPMADGLRMSAILNGRGHHEWTGKLPKRE